jgi:Tol biopolymer transport system component
MVAAHASRVAGPGRRGLRAVVVAALCAGFALAAFGVRAWAAKDDLDLVSRAAGADGPKANGTSSAPAVSADGRFVAFRSSASNLHPDDGDTSTDIFVRDLQANTVTLVSRASGAAGAKGNSFSAAPAISADGRFVAFVSFASNLNPDDDNDIDVFVRDVQTNTTTLVSRATGAGGAAGNGASHDPAISADGRFVAFWSFASNLHPDDGDATPDVFVRDLQRNTTTLVSRAGGATGAKADAASASPTISADGRFVEFDSGASNLHPDDNNKTADVFVRDLQTNTTTLVSRATGAGGTAGNSFSYMAAISADGRSVAFVSGARNFSPDDGDLTEDAFVRDLQRNTTTLASRAGGATGATADNHSARPRISADGRFVTFTSTASNLDPDDGDATEDVFVRDLQANTTTLVSRAGGATGAKGDGQSNAPAISGDGRFVAFSSRAANLHPADGDTDQDVFRRDVLGPPPVPPPVGPARPPVGPSDTTPPRITGLRVAPRCVTGARGRRAWRSVVLRVHYRLSEDARVAYAIVRRLNSSARGNCPRSLRPRRGGRPSRYGTVQTRELRTRAGTVIEVFGTGRRATAGRMATRGRASATLRLRPGTYAVALRALDQAGNRADARAKFWVLLR